MEVLTRVDAERIAALRERDEFFWLDLPRPAPEALDARRRAARTCTRSRSRTRGSSPSGRSSTATRTRCCSSTGRRGSPTTARPSSRSRSTCTSRAACCSPSATRACLVLDALHDELPGAQRVGGLRHLPRARRADGRDLPGHRPPRGPDRRASRPRCSTTRASRSSARSTGSSRRSSSSTAACWPQRDQFPAASAAILAAARARRASKREYLRDVGDHLVQVTGELQRQTRRPQHADLDVLQRERERA